MDHSNSIQFLKSVTSLYTGPCILNFAGNAEEEAEAAAAAKAKADGDAAAAEAAKKAEDEAAAAAAEEDPLTKTNPFEAGSSQHEAFENQRQKFKAKLETEIAKAKSTAGGDISGKLDQLLTALGALVPEKKPPAKREASAPEANEEEVKIVSDALRKIGLDPEQLVQDRRRQVVDNALGKIRKDYPNAEFDEAELVKSVRESGFRGTPYEMLEYALMRKYKGAIPAAAKAAEKDPAKREFVPILKDGTKKEVANADDKPSTKEGWLAQIRKKHGI